MPSHVAMMTLADLLTLARKAQPEVDEDLLRRAYDFAAERHKGQKRLSGEPYIQHLLEVTAILCRLRMDMPSLVTGLLHDVLEDTGTTVEELEQHFGAEVAGLVDGVTKIGKMIFRTREERQAESFRKMLVAMARDLRVILVKLADRLHNMRTLDSHPPERRQRIAQETRDIYAPLANRLGISWIKSELEDLSFKYQEPALYSDLSAQISQAVREREAYVATARATIVAKLKAAGVQAEVSGRVKHLYSVYRKMQQREVEFDQVYDLIAFRVLVHSVRECYEVLGVVHEAWKPVPGRFKDYIAMPKANLYQSLHTTVIGPQGKHMEVQIRTYEMHQIAEEGIAAHWKYKEGGSLPSGRTREDKRFGWLRQLLEWQREIKDSQEFMDAVKIDLFPEEVYVFTPRGDVRELPAGSSPVDFAYAIHSDVGHRCVGARVNGKLVPLKTPLKNGDVVEVMTSPNHHPSKDWLTFVRTSKARNKIRQWVKAEQREKSIDIGRELLEKELRKVNYSLKRALSGDTFSQGVEQLGFREANELMAAIGYGKLTAKQVVSRILPPEVVRPREEREPRSAAPSTRTKKRSKSAIKVQGIDDILVHFAQCCNPLPGDPIVGFITRGRGVSVHARDCSRILELDTNRIIPVEWDLRTVQSRTVRIRVNCLDRKGMLAALSTALTDAEANIVSAQVQMSTERRGSNIFEVEVKDTDHLQRVMSEVRKVKGVLQVERVRGS